MSKVLDTVTTTGGNTFVRKEASDGRRYTHNEDTGDVHWGNAGIGAWAGATSHEAIATVNDAGEVTVKGRREISNDPETGNIVLPGPNAGGVAVADRNIAVKIGGIVARTEEIGDDELLADQSGFSTKAVAQIYGGEHAGMTVGELREYFKDADARRPATGSVRYL